MSICPLKLRLKELLYSFVFLLSLKDVESPGEDDQGVEFTALNIEAMHARFSTGGSLDTNEGSSALNSSDDEVHIPRVSLVVGGVS